VVIPPLVFWNFDAFVTFSPRAGTSCEQGNPGKRDGPESSEPMHRASLQEKL